MGDGIEGVDFEDHLKECEDTHDLLFIYIDCIDLGYKLDRDCFSGRGCACCGVYLLSICHCRDCVSDHLGTVEKTDCP